MQIITLIPVSPAELALAADEGADALFGVWEQQETGLAGRRRDLQCAWPGRAYRAGTSKAK